MPEFEPRRAAAGAVYSYTTTDRTELADGDDLPEGAELAVETDADGEQKRFAVRYGVTKDLHADDEGVIHPKTAEDAAALDSFGLPVARKAIAESKAAAPAGKEK
jgi:hypothetical protein